MSLSGVLRDLLRPLYRRFAQTIPVEDPWEELSISVPLSRYGSGLEDDFIVYLRGPSDVTVSSLEDIKEWLGGCTYQRDSEQFGRDHWQHLLEFERRRVGDCDDYAMWTWRKLIELGRDARLVSGYCLPIDDYRVGHVWVVYRDAEELLLFDATASPTHMIRPLDHVRNDYLPEYGVDSHGKRYAYSGALLALKKRFEIPPHRTDAPTG